MSSEHLDVWPGCAVRHADGRAGRVVEIPVRLGADIGGGRRALLSGGGEAGVLLAVFCEGKFVSGDGFALDLSDSDTRSAYDRRLALELGAPVEAVDTGVVLWPDDASCWHIAAGVGFHSTTHEPGFVWRRELGPLADMSATILARALAWPTPK